MPTSSYPRVAATYAVVAVLLLATLALIAPHHDGHANANADRVESRR